MRGPVSFQPPQEMLKNIRRTRNAQPPVTPQAELLLRLGQKRSEDGVAEVPRGDDEPPPLLPYIHGQTPRRHVFCTANGVVLVVVVSESMKVATAAHGGMREFGRGEAETGGRGGGVVLLGLSVHLELLQELGQFLGGCGHHSC